MFKDKLFFVVQSIKTYFANDNIKFNEKKEQWLQKISFNLFRKSGEVVYRLPDFYVIMKMLPES